MKEGNLKGGTESEVTASQGLELQTKYRLTYVLQTNRQQM